MLVVSVWEVDKKKGDSLVGEALIPLNDPRTVQTNPWPLFGRGVAISDHPPLVTLHLVVPNYSIFANMTPYGPAPPPEAHLKASDMVNRLR